MEHTPAPWKLGGETDYYDDMILLPIEAKNGTLTHEIALVHTEGNQTTGEANARLIAAAPDMLEALKDLLEYAPAPKSVKQDYHYILRRELARKAIDKAEGGKS